MEDDGGSTVTQSMIHAQSSTGVFGELPAELIPHDPATPELSVSVMDELLLSDSCRDVSAALLSACEAELQPKEMPVISTSASAEASMSDQQPSSSSANVSSDMATEVAVQAKEAQEAVQPSVQTVIQPAKKHQTRSTRSTTGGHSQTQRRDYIVRFKGNNSRRWDGKDIIFDGEWLEETYSKEKLCPGRVLEIPYHGKGWRVVIMSVPASTSEGTISVPASTSEGM